MGSRRNMLSPLLVVAGTALVLVTPLTAAAASTPKATSTPVTTWITRPLPPATGTNLTRNEDGEPGLAVTPSGEFWVASDIAPYATDDPRVDPVAGLLSGADVWSSSDGGRNYSWRSDPFAEAATQFGLAGEDSDVTVATEKNSNGFYNIYATSLWVGSSGLAWSTDGGKTWQLNRLGGVPTQDRPWLAADGACDVFIAYHQLPTFTPVVNDYDVCTNGNVPVSGGATIDPANSTTLTLSDFPGTSNSFNKLTIDTSPTSPHRHAIYVPMSLCAAETETDLLIAQASGCNGTQYLVAVSTDGGTTFTYRPVVVDPSNAVLVWAATVSTDAAGNVYFTWSDAHNSYLNVSHDGGTTWSKSKKLNAPKTAAVYPTVAGGKAGRVDVAWYGTGRAGNSNDSKVMGKPNADGSAPWYVILARSTDGGGTFKLRTVSQVIHRGELCTGGSGCGDTNSRNLLDDFGLAISPTTGLDSIAYTDDQPQGEGGTTFTAFASELAAPIVHIFRPPHHPTSSGVTKKLAATGSTLAPPIAGLALVLLGLSLRRRRTVRGARAS
ncbi:MAG: hypothetical protein QOG34_162 [Frankiaceae bacterium]|nr:hypothetical protein [Frankiaceae bacterium]